MSKDEKTYKCQLILQQKSDNENNSGSKTYIDSLYNSNLEKKESINLKNYENINTEIYISKIKRTKTNINNHRKKEKNFCLALKTLNSENSLNNNSSKMSKNLLSKISEFSEMNPDLSKDYNVSKYLHHPIMKQIMKLGNQIIKRQNYNEYQVHNGLEINKPLVSRFIMKNIFEKFNLSFIGEESSNKNITNQNENINKNDLVFKERKKLKYFHRKNKSSITNYYYNENRNASYRTMNNCKNYNNNKKYVFHFRDNFSSLIGGQNKINFRDKDSATTITRDDCNKDIHIHGINDLNININIFNNNKNLEIINDFDETKENKIYSSIKKIEEISPKSNNKRLMVKNFFGNKDYNMKTFNKNYNLSMNKTLRKKYERTELIIKNINNKNSQNDYLLMKNLKNKFEQIFQNENNKTIENDMKYINEENSNNKNNETFIINEINNKFKFDIEFNESNNSHMKNNFIQFSELSSNKFSEKKSNNSIKSELRFSGLNSEEDSLNLKSINSNPNTNNQKTKNILSKDIYESPHNSNRNNHHFNLSSPFKEDNNDIIKNKSEYLYQINNISKKNNEEDQTKTVYDYTFYQKLLKNDDIMSKKYRIISKKEFILNTEIRLEILIWMMKTCEEFAFKRDTFHNACYYFDMYLTLLILKSPKNKKINLRNKSELELIGLTCIVISAKLEEIQLPRLKEYSELLSNKYDENSIIETEKKICSELRWKLLVITKNTWLSWYICQWDLFIDTIIDIKLKLLKIISEEDILYFRKPDDNSYYNFRKICQIIDIMSLDFHSYNYEQRILIAVSFFIILCNKYNLKYNFNKKNFDNKSKLSKIILDIYTKFISESFNYNFNNDCLQKGIKYFYANYINFKFVFDLPLLYQIHPSKMEGDSYEDFLTYQTTNDNFYKEIKDKIFINKNIRKVMKKLKGKNKKRFNVSMTIINK